jgi:Lon protease-like protein
MQQMVLYFPKTAPRRNFFHFLSSYASEFALRCGRIGHWRKIALGGVVNLLLPLFPLDLVLLPGVPLPLHVFEPRYKEMIAECLEERKPFGVVRASSDGVAEIGCTAEIIEVTKRYDDGRMDILTRGVERFEVVQVHDERSFLEAEFSVVEDEPQEASAQIAQRALSLYEEISKLAGASANGLAASDEHLSFQLAGSLPLDLDFKQKLLTTLSEPKRLQAVISYLEALLPGLRRASKARWN